MPHTATVRIDVELVDDAGIADFADPADCPTCARIDAVVAAIADVDGVVAVTPDRFEH